MIEVLGTALIIGLILFLGVGFVLFVYGMIKYPESDDGFVIVTDFKNKNKKEEDVKELEERGGLK
jgi:hypothetical protein